MKECHHTPGHLINIISNKLKRSADENLIHENVTIEQVQVLKMIHQNGGSVFQKDIEREFGVRRSTVTSAMQILEKKGFIVRTTSPEDSRAKLVTLTKEGEEKNTKLISFIKERDEKILSALSSEEQKALIKLLTKVLNNIE